VALVEEPHLRLLDGCSSIYELASSAISGDVKLSDLARQRATGDVLEYDPLYRGQSEWRILPAIDHPTEPARCMVSGTGLTHLGSARNRQSMHASTDEKLTDLAERINTQANKSGNEQQDEASSRDKKKSRRVA